MPDEIVDGIVLSGVGFTYPGGSHPTLHDIDLCFRAGSTIAIVGETVPGKSTLIKLLTGLYRPTTGTIAIDGIDLATIDASEWQHATTGAFQDFVRSNMRLGDGVGLGNLDRIDDRDEVRRALSDAGSDDLIESASRRARHAAWSVCRRKVALGRRMAAARARAWPHADTPATRRVGRTDSEPRCADRSRAVLSLSRRIAPSRGDQRRDHDPRLASLLDRAHRRPDRRRGRREVVETGTHAELMAAGGTYTELYELQARGYRQA